jgi:hypothetical protein
MSLCKSLFLKRFSLPFGVHSLLRHINSNAITFFSPGALTGLVKLLELWVLSSSMLFVLGLLAASCLSARSFELKFTCACLTVES